MAATRPRRGVTGPLTRNPPWPQFVSVSTGFAGAPAEGPATRPDPANEASAEPVHLGAGRSGSNDTPRPGAAKPAGMTPAATSTRSHSVSAGNMNGDPLPSGAVMLTSPTRYCVWVQEFRNAPIRAVRPVLSPPP